LEGIARFGHLEIVFRFPAAGEYPMNDLDDKTKDDGLFDELEGMADMASGNPTLEVNVENTASPLEEYPERSSSATPDARSTGTTPSAPRGPKKPWMDVYTAMLGIALLATIVGTLFLALELNRYDFQITPATPSNTLGRP
jgi:hypothetical protein